MLSGATVYGLWVPGSSLIVFVTLSTELLKADFTPAVRPSQMAVLCTSSSSLPTPSTGRGTVGRMWSRWQSWSSRRALQRHYGQLCALSDADARGAAREAWIRLRGQLHRCVHLDDQDRLGHWAPLHLLDAWHRKRPQQSRQGRAPPRHHDPWSTWAIAQDTLRNMAARELPHNA